MDSERSREYQACLALRHTPGVGARTWKKILRFFPTVQGAVADPRRWVRLGVAGTAQVQAFKSGLWQEPAAQETRMARMRRMNVLLWSDPEYPETLRQIPSPPLYLYYLGDPTLLAGPGLAVVGSRQCSRYGLDAARSISRDVSRAGICIVSGFAAGIDRQAHMAALEEIGSSIAVLGTGLDLVYPAVNKDLWLRLRDKGLIITEFPPGTKPDARNFPHRNRIISGLALGVLVIEAAVRSGSLITASAALEQGREVFALPGPVHMETYSGCHHLIRQGATLVQSAQDILRELQPQLDAGMVANQARTDPPIDESKTVASVHRPKLGGDDARLVAVLQGRDRVHIDALCAALGRDAGEVSRRLLVLEMQAIVTQLPGMYYQLQ